MSQIQVFIATHNRPELVLKAIESALNQNFDSFEVIVSDNSTNDDTGEIIKQFDDKRLIYRRRTPVMLSTAHFNVILQEATSDYFMIFHDDDVMHYNMLKHLHGILAARSELIAVGANARVYRNGKVKWKRFNNRLRSDITIANLEQIIKAYSIPAFVPFPSYLYRREVAEKLRFNPEHGGKHNDTAFVFDLLTLGSIVFVAVPLMDYFKHENQDSVRYEFKDFMKLINYIKKLSGFSGKHPMIRRFRIQNIYGELKYLLLNKNIPVFSSRYNLLIKLLFSCSFTEYFPKILLWTIYSKIIKSD
jgi:glycosyltransferase involved in cell wall biosynthesis